jgi:NitT/TauT family transport system permease protein
MIGARHGIGALVLMPGNLMQTDQLIAGVLALSALELLVAQLIGLAERRLLRWR